MNSFFPRKYASGYDQYDTVNFAIFVHTNWLELLSVTVYTNFTWDYRRPVSTVQCVIHTNTRPRLSSDIPRVRWGGGNQVLKKTTRIQGVSQCSVYWWKSDWQTPKCNEYALTFILHSDRLTRKTSKSRVSTVHSVTPDCRRLVNAYPFCGESTEKRIRNV